MRASALFATLALCGSLLVGAQTAKPVLKVAADGLPAGHATPEGAACDLARAFITHNPTLFKSTCIKPFGSPTIKKQFQTFYTTTAQQMIQEGRRSTPSPGGPKTIGKLFAARSLSRDGPASAGYAVFDFHDIKFVDIGVILYNGQRVMNRTMVIQTANGSWYVDPIPGALPLLSMGLNQESASTQDFTQAYTIKH